MIGYSITGEDGKPLEQYTKLSESKYQPPTEVIKLFERCQRDYQVAYNLQHRPFEEFDDLSMLQRAKRDQQTFGVYVGAEWLPAQKRWRWKGRKNTARNKMIGLLAHMIAGMLFPQVNAQNMETEEDKETAKVMRILVEEHLRKANYETKFMYMALSALVNPAVFVEVDYVVAYQTIKEQLKGGQVNITQAIDTLMSGLFLNIIPVDEILLADFFTGDIQKQPFIIRVKRIPWDAARKIWGTKDNFKYVEAGKTRVFLTGQEHQTLFDIEWTEADRGYVQHINIQYRDEDLEVDWVGGVFMGNEENVYNTNPFKHRRMSLLEDEWKTIPVYRYAKSGFEPLDPSGRFAYFKSAAAKEYWDDATQNKMHQLLIDGTYLDVIKPLFITGLAKADSTVIAPGAVVGIPSNSDVKPYQLGPNLAAAMQAMRQQEEDLSASTLDPVLQGQTGPKQTAFAVSAAITTAKIMMGMFSFLIADLIRQVGELTVDCLIQHTFQGEIDATVPEALSMKYKMLLSRTKENGKTITNKIVFTDALMGREMTDQDYEKYAWDLWDKAGGKDSNQRIYHVNPYRFARTTFSIWVDPDAITSSAIGINRDQKMQNIQMLTLPFVAPFTDQKAVADEVIEEYGGTDPDRFKMKQPPNPNQMLNQVMGQGAQQSQTPKFPQPGNPVQVGAGSGYVPGNS